MFEVSNIRYWKNIVFLYFGWVKLLNLMNEKICLIGDPILPIVGNNFSEFIGYADFELNHHYLKSFDGIL